MLIKVWTRKGCFKSVLPNKALPLTTARVASPKVTQIQGSQITLKAISLMGRVVKAPMKTLNLRRSKVNNQRTKRKAIMETSTMMKMKTNIGTIK